ncbi:hypothetical protein Tco_0799378 [Tanacetum coccineum]|uniref:Ribosomal protein L32 n=1 Tax=Tanacetum coccineum TaxID=301880 RepID=A0ABQ4ZTW6_9ASTR
MVNTGSLVKSFDFLVSLERNALATFRSNSILIFKKRNKKKAKITKTIAGKKGPSQVESKSSLEENTT